MLDGRLRARWPRPRRRASCASSATCPTTSRRRSCSTCSRRSTRIADQHFMLQKEVVERMAAAPGSKDYGRLSVMLQWRYDDRGAVRRAARGVRSAAARRLGGAADDAAAARRAASTRRCCGELVTVGVLAAPQAAAPHARPLARRARRRRDFDLQRRAEEVPVAEWIALAVALKNDPGGSAPPSRREGAQRDGAALKRQPSAQVERLRRVQPHAVSNALLISGMFVPKLLFAAVLAPP